MSVGSVAITILCSHKNRVSDELLTTYTTLVFDTINKTVTHRRHAGRWGTKGREGSKPVITALSLLLLLLLLVVVVVVHTAAISFDHNGALSLAEEGFGLLKYPGRLKYQGKLKYRGKVKYPRRSTQPANHPPPLSLYLSLNNKVAFLLRQRPPLWPPRSEGHNYGWVFIPLHATK